MNSEIKDLEEIKDLNLDEEGSIETEDYEEEENDNEGAEEICDVNALLGGFNSEFDWSVKLPHKDPKTGKTTMKKQKFVLQVLGPKEQARIRRTCKNSETKYTDKLIQKVVKEPSLTQQAIRMLPEPLKLLILETISERCGHTNKIDAIAENFL